MMSFQKFVSRCCLKMLIVVEISKESESLRWYSKSNLPTVIVNILIHTLRDYKRNKQFLSFTFIQNWIFSFIFLVTDDVVRYLLNSYYTIFFSSLSWFSLGLKVAVCTYIWTHTHIWMFTTFIFHSNQTILHFLSIIFGFPIKFILFSVIKLQYFPEFSDAHVYIMSEEWEHSTRIIVEQARTIFKISLTNSKAWKHFQILIGLKLRWSYWFFSKLGITRLDVSRFSFQINFFQVYGRLNSRKKVSDL